MAGRTGPIVLLLVSLAFATAVPALTTALDDPEGDVLTYSSSNLPRGATLDPKTGAFVWTPDFAQAGVFTVRTA